MLDFEQLYEKHFPTVYGMCLSVFADADFAIEITQEAFTRAYTHLDELRDEEKFLPWVIRIAMHYGYRQRRLQTLRSNPLPDGCQTRYTPLFSLPDLWESDSESFLAPWLAALGEEDRLLFVLKHYLRWRNDDICRELGKPLSTVKRRLSRLKAKLREDRDRDRAGG